jgi:hypothetical protein
MVAMVTTLTAFPRAEFFQYHRPACPFQQACIPEVALFWNRTGDCVRNRFFQTKKAGRFAGLLD